MVWPDDLISILLATVLGGGIGLERELSGKAAGLRTNLLICLGKLSKHLDRFTGKRKRSKAADELD